MAYRERLLLQKSRWVTPYASLTRYESKITESKVVPARLGLSPMKHDLTWVKPTLDSTFNDPDAGVIIDGPSTDYSAVDDTDNIDIPGEDEAALCTVLSDEDSDSDEREGSFDNIITWIVPVRLHLFPLDFCMVTDFCRLRYAGTRHFWNACPFYPLLSPSCITPES